MALSYAQIEGLWVQAGGSSALAPVAAAVAMAESGGNPTAHNATPPDDSYGLWQINMYGSLGPARRAQFGLSSNTALYDPLTNARAAVAIAKGGFGPWTTFTSGAYKKYLNGAVPPDMSAGGAGAPDATQASVASDITSSIISAFYPVINMTGNLATFMLLIAGGALLTMAGFYMLFANSGAVRALKYVTPGVK